MVWGVLILGTWEAELSQFSENWTFCLRLPSTTTVMAFKTLAIISLIFLKQEHYYHFQELSTYLASFLPPSLPQQFSHFKKEKIIFLPLPANTKCLTPLKLKWFPAVQYNKCITCKGKHSIQAWGGKAAASEPQQQNRSDRASVVKTLVIFSEVTQFTPVNNQAHDIYQAAKIASAEEEDLQPFALCLASDNN